MSEQDRIRTEYSDSDSQFTRDLLQSLKFYDLIISKFSANIFQEKSSKFFSAFVVLKSQLDLQAR